MPSGKCINNNRQHEQHFNTKTQHMGRFRGPLLKRMMTVKELYDTMLLNREHLRCDMRKLSMHSMRCHIERTMNLPLGTLKKHGVVFECLVNLVITRNAGAVDLECARRRVKAAVEASKDPRMELHKLHVTRTKAHHSYPKAAVAPPDVLDRSGDHWFDIERIVCHYPRGANCHKEATHYVVKWLGYPSCENTKEPARRIVKDCKEVVTTYWRKHRRETQRLSSRGAVKARHKRHL